MPESDWITVQFFVSDTGACEVQGNKDDYRKMRCTCSKFNWITRCKHVKYVRNHIKVNKGIFSIDISEHVSVDLSDEDSNDELDTILSGNFEFRDILLKYGKVVYLP
jgi:catalase